MKIGIDIAGNDAESAKAAEKRAFEKMITGAAKGDWEAKNQLVLTFQPLLNSLAEKRTSDVPTLNKYLEAGKEGLMKAARKYTPSVGPDRFRIFALDFIEAAMDSAAGGGGFFARLFGRK